MPCRPQDLDWVVPKEYITNEKIVEKLKNIELDIYTEDTIFMLYYTHPRDILSVACVQKLYRSGWRYHKRKNMWLKRHDDTKEVINDPNGRNIGEKALFK